MIQSVADLAAWLAARSPVESVIIRIIATCWQPTSRTDLLKIGRTTGLIRPEDGIHRPKDLDPVLRTFQNAGLLHPDNAIDLLLADLILTDYTPQEIVRTLAQTASRTVPMPQGDLTRPGPAQTQHLLRAFRLSLFAEDSFAFFQFAPHALRQIGTRINREMLGRIFPLTDPQSLSRLPRGMQAAIATDLLMAAATGPEKGAMLAAYVKENELPRNLPPALQGRFYAACLLWDLFSGQISPQTACQTRHMEYALGEGLDGLCHLLSGDAQTAKRLWEEELRLFRKEAGTKSIFLHGIAALPYMFLLLVAGDPASLKQATRYRNQAKKQAGYESRDSLIAFAKAIESLSGKQDPEQFESEVEIWAYEEEAFSILMVNLCRILVHGSMPASQIPILKDMQEYLTFCQLPGLAAEFALLAGAATEEIAPPSGYVPMAAMVCGAAPWEQQLNALLQLGEEPAETKSQTPSRRIVWVLQILEHGVMVQPKEQKRSAKGGWTKGRNVSLSRLHAGEDIAFFTPQDQNIRGAVTTRNSYYRDVEYRIDSNRALPLLCGHPLVFRESGKELQPIELLATEPEIRILRKEDHFHLLMHPLPEGQKIRLMPDGPTRYRVVAFTPEQRRAAAAIGPKGIRVPKEQTAPLLKAIPILSSRMMVASDLVGDSGNARTITADATPHVLLAPAGEALRADIVVRPLGADGPVSKPGRGGENVMAEVDGVRSQATRDLAAETTAASRLIAACPSLLTAGKTFRWYSEETEEGLDLLAELRMAQEQNLVVTEWPEGEKIRVRGEIGLTDMMPAVRTKTDWFAVTADIAVDEKTLIAMTELIKGITEESRFVPIGEGEFVALTRDLKKRLLMIAGIGSAAKEGFRFPAASLPVLEELLTGCHVLKTDSGYEKRCENLARVRKDAVAIPTTLNAKLRPYQEEGFRWMARLADMGAGACLADDMGLGKTIQTLALLLRRAAKGPALVIAPTSVCGNWIREAARFAPSLTCHIFGSCDRESTLQNIGPRDLLITSYGLLLTEAERLSAIRWHSVVLDEAQAIKNLSAKRTKAAMGLVADFRLITTGTPVENHLGELYTLFSFINKGLLGTEKEFRDRFSLPIQKEGDPNAARNLRRLIRPFVLRRTKAEVLDDLPEKTEILVSVAPEPEEAAFYETLRMQALDRIAEAEQMEQGQRQMRVLAELTRLRQAACHPELAEPGCGLTSAKLTRVVELAQELAAAGHRALIFSQFTSHLALVRKALQNHQLSCLYLDGQTPPAKRQERVQQFQNGEGSFFLISLKAGGTGLNLTAATYVLHLDPWWNPAAEDQASDRAYRIGQRYPVTVYRLVTTGTIEEKIVHLHQTKRQLANDLLEGADISARLRPDELVALIRNAE